jgi:rSAM/selenodomain-associated transferase 1
MCRAPRAGAAKTRLVPPLMHAEAAALSACFLRDTAENIAAAGAIEEVRAAGGAAGVVVFTPADAGDVFAELLPASFRLLAQRGADLTARLRHATDDLLRAGYETLCLMNADSPTLPQATLAAAIKELARAGDRVVLGPARDGGYYLIGLKRAHVRLFEGIEWSTERVLAQTRARAAELGLEVSLLPEWYDVDDAAALARLCAELFAARGVERNELPRATADKLCVSAVELCGYAAPHTRAYLESLFAREGRGRIWPAGDGDESSA